ncbi:MAG TPA: hypothetical protein VFE20_03450, partial [Thermoleophilia bacterium]|nr:hypothetical protein [Thermoleophilia bacterium]
MKDQKSSELYRQAQRLMPGGVNSPVRAMRSVGREPLFIERADGSRMWDADGNEYIDFVGSWGPETSTLFEGPLGARDRARPPGGRSRSLGGDG